MTSRRNTIQKDLVRNAVYEMRRHVTANEVYEFIKEEYPTIGMKKQRSAAEGKANSTLYYS